MSKTDNDMHFAWLVNKKVLTVTSTYLALKLHKLPLQISQELLNKFKSLFSVAVKLFLRELERGHLWTLEFISMK